MTDSQFRVHPSIGFARVGTSNAHYLAPETPAGHPGKKAGEPVGGLPVRAGTECDPITSSDVRDAQGALTRQAARFRIYRYDPSNGPETYPMGQQGEEIGIGSKVRIGGATRSVVDIVWTVHMANKKAAWYESPDDDGIIAWYKSNDGDPEPTPPLRNQDQGTDAQDPSRLRKLVIDPGPRTIKGTDAGPVELDADTTPSYWNTETNRVVDLEHYPTTFPRDAFPTLNPPGVNVIHTLGTLQTDAKGRLVVVAAFGYANSFSTEGPQYGFVDPVNNDSWFDDTGDGPVEAVLVLDDGSTHVVEGRAWVVSTDPAYAPQISNVVSLWDDTYDSWVRKLELRPDLFAGGKFVDGYVPSFEDEVRPIFLSAGLQRWITNLSTLGISAHDRVAALGAESAPGSQLNGLGLIRRPVDPDELTLLNPDDPNAIGDGRGDPVDPANPGGDDRRMPLSLGDAGRSLLSLTKTQYACLQRWDREKTDPDKRIDLNPGERLDMASLQAGLGGRFSPGIDITYICREPNLYVQDWKTSGTGPFRISQKAIDYARWSGQDDADGPALTLGWMPRRPGNDALEPGDISKFMAIPWHADYNSCGTHLPAPNLPMGNTLYWSWPAQRPVAVYAAKHMDDPGRLPTQSYSVRGEGTMSFAQNPPPFGPADPAWVGRYQKTPQAGDKFRDGTPAPIDARSEKGIMRIVDNWMRIGVVIQASQIDDEFPDGRNADTWKYDPNHFLEVKSQFADSENGDPVVPWPNTVAPGSD